jgi:hypothetical protein
MEDGPDKTTETLKRILSNVNKACHAVNGAYK